MAPKDSWALAAWPEENSQIDFVFRQCVTSEEAHYEFVQLKEVAPGDIPSARSLQALLDDLPHKYPSSGGLTIGVHLNRTASLSLGSLRLPALSDGSLWLFGLGGEPPHDSFLVGDLLKKPMIYFFNYPRLLRGESFSHWEGALDDEPMKMSKA